jgi:hypothetical protein
MQNVKYQMQDHVLKHAQKVTICDSMTFEELWIFCTDKFPDDK